MGNQTNVNSLMQRGSAQVARRGLARDADRAARLQAGYTDSVLWLPLEDIIIDETIQVRVGGVDADTVEQYAVVMAESGGWGPFPAVDVHRDGDALYLSAGFQRVAAARLATQMLEREGVAGISDIPAEVRPGGYEAAVEHAEEDNLTHGKALSHADKRYILERRLERGHDWTNMSSRAISRALGVDRRTIDRWRQAWLDDSGGANAPPDADTRLGKDGKTYDVSGIRAANEARANAPTPAPVRGHVSQVMEAVDGYFEQFPGHPTVGISSLVTRTSLTSADVVAACDALVDDGRLVAVIGGQYARPARPRSTAPTPPPQYPSYPATPPPSRPSPAPRPRYASDPEVDQSPLYDEDGVRIAHGEDYDALAAQLSEFIGQAIDLAKTLEDLRQTPVPPSYADALAGQAQDALDYLGGYDSRRGYVPGVTELINRLRDRCAATIVARESGELDE